MSNYSIESYGYGFLIADYSGDRGEQGAAYCGVSLKWSSQPIVRDPFPTRATAEDAVERLMRQTPEQKS